ncbi:hypothetical protein B0A55_12759, partial [Friedmanniomyces simplex]
MVFSRSAASLSGYHRAKLDEIEQLKKSNQSSAHLEAEVDKLQAECVDEQARRYFKRVCDGDTDALALWKRFRDLSIVKYKETFAPLNFDYDEYWGESQVSNESMERACETCNRRDSLRSLK